MTSWAVHWGGFSLVLFFCSMLAGSASQPETQLYSFKSRHMGVDFRIDLFAADSKKAQSAANAAFARVAEIDAAMSDYKVDSELSQLSMSSGSGNQIQVSQELWTVLNKAKNIHRLSSGAFDDNIVILNANWEGFRMDVSGDISGNTAQEMAIAAIRRSDGVRRIHIKDFGTGATTTNIAP